MPPDLAPGRFSSFVVPVLRGRPDPTSSPNTGAGVKRASIAAIAIAVSVAASGPRGRMVVEQCPHRSCAMAKYFVSTLRRALRLHPLDMLTIAHVQFIERKLHIALRSERYKPRVPHRGHCDCLIVDLPHRVDCRRKQTNVGATPTSRAIPGS